MLSTRYLVVESKGKFVSRRKPFDWHKLQSLEMAGTKLEGFTPNLLVKVALACGLHQVRWVRHHLRKAHKAFPALLFAMTFTFVGGGTLLAS